MYLTRAYVQNSGPLRKLELALPFHNEHPLPVILVGGNGSGKTNFLSLVADALLECAAAHYTNILPSSGLGRNWFRLIGGATITAGAPGGCAILKFQHLESNLTYYEKGGTLPVQQVRDAVDASMREGIQWEEKGAAKSFTVSKETAEAIFEAGIYVYFPSSRAESPFWLNRRSLPDDSPDFEEKMSGRLSRPIYVERGIDKLKKWLTTLLVDSRAEFRPAPASFKIPTGAAPHFEFRGHQPSILAHQAVWDEVGRILGLILGDEKATLCWMGQHRGVGYVTGENVVLSLNSLSAGQATLFNIFGTLLRYANDNGIALRAANASGICVVDEIDAHMHIDLQYRALPKLVKMFPSVQFLMSSHSPLFALGMTREYGDELSIVDMPTGSVIQAESYAEFGKALEAFEDTKAFRQRLDALAESAGQSKAKLLVLLEGATDPAYLAAAAKALGRELLLASIDLKWVGYQDAAGNAKHTGTSALDSVYKTLSVKPEIGGPPTLLLYDCDAPKRPIDHARLFVRSIPPNAKNARVTKGIENLLPEGVFTPDMYRTESTPLGDGGQRSTVTLKKTELCARLCAEPQADIFANFGVVLDLIAEIAAGGDPNGSKTPT